MAHVVKHCRLEMASILDCAPHTWGYFEYHAKFKGLSNEVHTAHLCGSRGAKLPEARAGRGEKDEKLVCPHAKA